MAHYSGSRFSSLSANKPSGNFFSLGDQLATRRGLRQKAAPKPISVKPSLTTSKQKEAEIQKTLEKNYMPSGLKLAKLRQLAAQHKILGQQSRDFLHRSEAGQKIQGTEGLKKFETELLEAEREAIDQQSVHNPMKFEYRKEPEHPERLAKKMVKGLYHDAAEQAKSDAAAKAPNLMEQRQERLAMIHGILDRGQQQPQQSAAPATAPERFSSPALYEPTPLNASTAPVHAPTAFAPLTGGSHITQAPAATSEPAVNVGIPVAVHHEATTPAPSAEPTVPVAEPTAPTTPEPSVSLPDTSNVDRGLPF